MYFEDLAVGDVELSDEIDADRDDMIAHARANDPCPIHIDPDAARRTPFGDVIASFGDAISRYMRLMHRLELVRATEDGSLGAAGWEVTFGGAARPGDKTRVRQTVLDKRLTSRSDRGPVTTRNELLKQSDATVVSIDARWLLATGPT